MESIDLTPLLCCLVALFGLAVGSFLNVVIYRLPRGKSLIRPGSSCPKCRAAIPWYLNVPVFSYLVLRGKCHTCGCKIPVRYPLVEAGTALLMLLFYWRYGLSVTTIGFWLLGLSLIVVFFIDLEFGIIPNVITLPGILVGFAFSFFSDHLTVASSALGILAGGGTFYVLGILGRWLFKKDSLGGGDVKLAAMLGAFLGPVRVFLIFIGSAFLGLVVSAVILALSARFRKDRILPFGPFLVAAALIVIFYGQRIVDWYWGTFIIR
jgi:leader peptidase (prepilin peptidase)/N-methyltransferase